MPVVLLLELMNTSCYLLDSILQHPFLLLCYLSSMQQAVEGVEHLIVIMPPVIIPTLEA